MTTTINRDDLVELLRSGRPILLVEALGPAYYTDAHLPGAVNVPPDEVDRLAPRLLPDPTAEIVVYCSATCDNAGIVACRLRDLGYGRVRMYPGGKEDWVEHGLPVERDV
jgi:rhodanese-related sulfurtransferase